MWISVAKTFPRERMTNSPTIVWLANLTRLSSIFGVNQNEEQIRAHLRKYKKQLDRLVEGGNSNPEFKALAVDITKTLEGSITTDLQKLNASLLDAAGGVSMPEHCNVIPSSFLIQKGMVILL
jgi:hypothetical protein